MLRSLSSGVSGMKSNQIKMDVIGNNIANVNTIAFKGARVNFKDMLNQTLQGTSAPNENIGGTNAKQVGLGVSVASVDTNMNQGGLQPTGRATDFAIEGNGFFVVYNNVETKFTRDGSFTLDKNGALVTSEGLHVRGYNPGQIIDENTQLSDLVNIYIPLEASFGDPPTNVNLTSFNVEKDGTIKAIYGDNTVIIGKIAIATFQNPVGLLKQGGNLYVKSSNSGEPKLGEASSPGYGTIQQGLLEMSNVDLAEQFTEMIVTSRAFQANSRTITTSDELLQELLNLKR
ncbi:MAG: flgF [Caloramator sp.]|jgi:flagellar hook protein FlgE|uniref:flagellar hook-basal body complex protein n=1 Tax=Caloramator sp. TaxID=1871330 RepID=UPI001D674A55|nr:flagellar hook-basal body complex protein [Caloramator sp.]MBZ4663093.1 flgF [Caloramator sp.]